MPVRVSFAQLSSTRVPVEGYVLHTYGKDKYLRHAVASLVTLRRHDSERPVALYCTESHRTILRQQNLAHLFSPIALLPEAHQSIVGFKLHLHRFMPFERCLYVDADIVWCRPLDKLWTQLSVYPFTATGLDRADFYFGGPKSLGIVWEFLRDRRQRTLDRFGLTSLPRVQAGMIYASDTFMTREVCEAAASFLARSGETHFRTRFHEGRTEESCEWSLAMAMSRLRLPVYPWRLGYDSPQMDYIKELTSHTDDFEDVVCKYYCDRFVNDIRGLRSPRLRRLCFHLATMLLRRKDYLLATPYALHFSWLHEKAPFDRFAEHTWDRLVCEAATTSNSGSPSARKTSYVPPSPG